MDIDPVKAVALISGILAILEKIYVYGKVEYIKKSPFNYKYFLLVR